MSETRTITVIVDSDGQPVSHPMIYDLANDTMRPATQADVDALLRVQENWFKVARLVQIARGDPAACDNG